MATKKTPINKPGSGMDDLDFDLDSLSFPTDNGSKKKKKDRKAVTSVAVGFAEGAREQFTNKSYIKRTIAKALPDGYETAFNAADTVTSGARELYHSAAQELRPSLPAMRKATASLLPKTKKFLPKSIADKLESFSKGSDSQTQGTSQGEADNDSIRSALGEVFETQMEAAAKQEADRNARGEIRDRITDKKTNQSLSQLTAIRQGVDRQVAYQDQILAKYQKRSLELQYRQYFTLRDMLKLQVDDSSRNRAYMDALVRNTGLPEVAKIKLGERYSDMLRSKLVGRSQSAMTDYISNFSSNLLKNLKGQVAGMARGINDATYAHEQMSDAAQMAREMGADFDPAHMVGSGIGGMAAEGLGNHLARKGKAYLSKHDKLRKGGAATHNFFDLLAGRVNKWAGSQTEDMGWKGLIAQAFKDMTPRAFLDTRLGGSPILKADEAASFNNHTQRSITEVIPGYLSRILREVTVLRTGDDSTGQIVYNQDRGQFTTLKAASKDAQKRLLGGSGVEYQRRAVGDFLDHLDPENKLNSEQRQKFAKQILMDQATNPSLDIDRYTQANEGTSELDPATRAAVAKLLGNRYKTSDGKVDHEALRATLNQFNNMRGSLNDPRNIVKAYVDQGSSELFDHTGIIKQDGFSKSLDYSKYYDLLLSGGLGGSGPGGGLPPGWSPPPGAPPPTSEQKKRIDAMIERGKSSMATAGKGIPAAGKGIFGNLYHTASQRVKTGYGAVSDLAKTVSQDLYLKGKKNKPALEESVLRAGGYIDAKTKQVITNLTDIRGPVETKSGQLVLSAKDLASGLYTRAGENLSAVFPNLKAFWSDVSNKASHSFHSFGAALSNPFASSPNAMKRAQVSVIGGPRPTMSSSELIPVEPTPVTMKEPSAIEMLLESFRDTNREQLDAVLDALESQGEGGSGGKRRVFNIRQWGSQKLGSLGRGVRKAGSLFGSYTKNVYKGAWAVAKAPFKIAGGAFDLLANRVPDIYVKGDKVPSIFAKKLRKGAYFDVKSKKTIRSIKDITGPVIDKSDEGNQVISQEDFDRGLVDRVGHPVLKSIGSGIGRLAGAFANYGSAAFSLPFMIGGAGLRGVNKILGGLFHRPQAADVYVKDEPGEPKLYGVKMRKGRYFCIIGGKPKKIKHPGMINGAVYETVDGKPEIVLTVEEFRQGLVGADGKKFRGPGIVAGIARGASSAIGGLASVTGSMIGATYKVMGSLIGAGGRGLAEGIRRLTGGKINLRGKHQSPEIMIGAQSVTLLDKIYQLLEERLPKPEHIRKGSWKDQAREELAEEAGEGGGHATRAGGGGLLGWLRDKFSGQQEDQDDDGNNYYIDNNGKRVKGIKKGTFGRNLKARGKRLGRKLGRSRLGRLGKRFGGKLLRSRGGRLVGRLASRLGGSRAIGIAGRALGGGARVVGGLGRAAFGVGRAALGLGTLEGVGTGLATAGSGLLSVGGAAASGIATAASAVGSGLATAAGAIGSVLSAPVVLGAAAVAAIGVGIYYGVKYYNLKKSRPLRKYRMAQYGVDINQSVWPMAKVQDLEDLLKDKVSISDGRAELSKDAFKDMDKIYKIFGLKKSWYNPTGWFGSSDDDKDKEQRDALLQWLSFRFKPIYLAWRAILAGISKTTALDDLDSLTPEQKLKLLDATSKQVDSSLYALGASPFGDDPISVDSKVVDAAYTEAKTKFEEEAKKNTADKKDKKGGIAPATVATAGAAIAKVGGDPTASTKAADKAKASSVDAAVAAKTQKIAAAATASAAVAGVMSVDAVSLKSSPIPRALLLGSRLTAVQAIRYKAYGLINMQTDRVKALFLLETDVLDKVVYDPSGNASFSDKPDYYFEKYAAYFGISPSDKVKRVAWTGWFQGRFIPVLLQFASASKHVNLNTDPRDGDDKFTPMQLLNIANAIIATTSMGIDLKQSVSIWTLTLPSPWDDALLNGNSSTTEENISALKNASKNKIMDQQSAELDKANKKADAANAAPDTADAQRGPSTTTAVATQQAQAVKANAQLNPASSSASAGPYVASVGGSPTSVGTGTPIGRTFRQPGNGTGGDVNKIPLPTEGAKGWDAVKGTIIAAARMAGMDPNLMATFASIESNFNPNAKAPTSSASGLFQFINSTWKAMLAKYGDKYGISPNTSQYDPRANALMGAEFLKENSQYLEKALGRPPTDTEMYMAHFLGAGGAKSILTAPDDAIASQLNPAAARSNQSIFYAKGGRPRTKKELVATLNALVKRKSFTASPSDLKVVALTDKVGNGTPLAGGATTTTVNGPAGGQSSVVPMETEADKRAAENTAYNDGRSNTDGAQPARADFSSLRAPALDRAPGANLSGGTPSQSFASSTQSKDTDVAISREREQQHATVKDMISKQNNQDINQNVNTMTTLLSAQLTAQNNLVTLFTQAVTLLGGIHDKSGELVSQNGTITAAANETAATGKSRRDASRQYAAGVSPEAISLRRSDLRSANSGS